MLALLWCACAVSLIQVQASPFPPPPRQTAAQKQIFATKQRAAVTASAAATPQLLRLLDELAVRTALSNACPAAAHLPAPLILDRLRAEVGVAELAHTFASQPDGFFTDVSLDLLRDFQWFLNPWQVRLLEIAKGGAPPEVNPLELSAEPAVFGCVPFQNESFPTWTEAADRLVYTANNVRQLDTASAMAFGDIGVVFKTNSVRDMVEIFPLDSGVWEASCNVTLNWGPHPPHTNLSCSASDPTPPVGTLDAFDHVILLGFQLWGGANLSSLAYQVATLFGRTSICNNYATISNTSQADQFKFYESNLLGNPRLFDVKFMVPLFGSLFGSQLGTQSVELAVNNSWPVLWALADATNGSTRDTSAYQANQRFLDPRSAGLLNITLPNDALHTFEQVWTEAAKTRILGPLARQTVQGWWNRLLQAGLPRFAPLSAQACLPVADLDDCIGVDLATLQCACITAKGSS